MLDPRFEILFTPEPNTGCWLWHGNRNPAGYGLVKRRPRVVLAHRYAWQLYVGRLDGPHVKVLHRCDTPECVNPDHLFLGTQADNIRDMETKRRARHPCGEHNGRAKLGAATVQKIREQYATGGVTQQQLAAQYGVNQTTVSDIVLLKKWTSTIN